MSIKNQKGNTRCTRQKKEYMDGREVTDLNTKSSVDGLHSVLRLVDLDGILNVLAVI